MSQTVVQDDLSDSALDATIFTLDTVSKTLTTSTADNTNVGSYPLKFLVYFDLYPTSSKA